MRDAEGVISDVKGRKKDELRKKDKKRLEKREERRIEREKARRDNDGRKG